MPPQPDYASLPQNETVRIACNLSQRIEVAGVLCGQLAVGFELVRLMCETLRPSRNGRYAAPDLSLAM
jgi:hypothetical protein